MCMSFHRVGQNGFPRAATVFKFMLADGFLHSLTLLIDEVRDSARLLGLWILVALGSV